MLRIGEMQATEPAEKLYGGADVNKEHSSESLEKSEKAHILGIAEKKKINKLHYFRSPINFDA